MAKGKVIPVALIGYILAGVSVAASQSQSRIGQTFFVFGEGTASCGAFLEAVQAERKAKGSEDSSDTYRNFRYGGFIHFADGFLSGANATDPYHHMVGQHTEHAGRMAWLENYCRANPLDVFLAALVSLRKFLISGG